MEEKICPMTGKPCGPNCGWFVPDLNKCAMILIADSVFPLMMAVTGEYSDDPLSRIADNTDLIGEAAQEAVKAIEAVASAI